MQKNYIVALFVFLILGTTTQAQKLEKFSEKPNEFISQLKDYMTSSKRKVLENTYQEFEAVFTGGLYSEEEIQQILKTGNAMLNQRMNASPYFSNYLKGLTVLKNNVTNSQQRFKEWHEVLDAILNNIENRRLKPFQTFLLFSHNFFEHKAIRYADSGGTSWIILDDGYTITYDKEQKIPMIQFENIILEAVRKDDKIQIEETSGTFYPVSQNWVGKGGKVTWQRFGLEEVYAELGDYEIEVKKSLYQVKDVTLHYPLYFGEKPVKGRFEDKLTSGSTTSSYPRFESKEAILKVENIGEGIEFIGGFRLQGTTVYGYGSKDLRARIDIYDENKELAFRANAELFKIKREERIVGERVESTLYFEGDSIYHPSVNFRFEIPAKELQLSRGERGSDRNPFYNSLHQMNMDTEKISVFVGRDSVIIGEKSLSLAKQPDVYFESLKYFKEADYQRIQNISTVNPIAIMKVTAEKEGTYFLDADLVASRINSKFTVENIQSLIYDLVSNGFINYDSDKKEIEVKEKVFHYAQAAQKKVDYDVLKIHSETDNTNAVLNMKDKNIEVKGVDYVEFSSSQKVAIKPINDQVTIQKNRNMEFDGKLFTGFGSLQGKDFHFNYDKFSIDLDSVRFFDLFVPTGEMDKNQNPVAKSIGSRIEHLSGVLLIDAPNNKSGREDIDIFPSLQSKEKSFVYYDYKGTQSGAYSRDSFYFELDKFSFNHLDKINSNDLKFKGMMHSAGVFPDFRETLELQEEDSSLGFETETPEGGYEAFQGKGIYKGKIGLSNRGMLGNGNVKYLGASIDSEDLVFKPNQMTGSAEQFALEEDRKSEIQVPQARGIDVKIDWRPYVDSMYIRSKEAPFDLFKAEEHTLKGSLVLSPGGLKGIGVLNWEKAAMNSKLFNFGAYSAQADTTDIQIRAFNTEELALKTSNLNGSVDFDEQVGSFKANDEFLETVLPYNQYTTTMNEFDWDMKDETITFRALENKYGTFKSIHPDQDSLTFDGKTAFYDLKSNQLKIGGVPYIVAADAFVYPDSGAVEVLPGGVMTTLNNAKIIADTINQYHVINRATVNIKGKKLYKATGFYEYNIGERKQEIKFNNIVGQRVGKGKRSEKKVVTRATGEVIAADSFYMDTKTEFRGQISLNAESKNLNFNGFAQLDAPDLPNRKWFAVNSEIDRNDVVIQYDTPKSFESEPLETGLFLSKETARVYPRVMSPLYFRKDRPILPVTGVFKYDKVKDQFIFGDSLKVTADRLTGNCLIYKLKTNSIEAEGKFNIGSGLKYVKVSAAGQAKTSFESNEIDTLSGYALPAPIDLKLMAGIDLIIPERLLKMIITDLNSASFDAQNINYTKDKEFYKKAALELFPPTKDVLQAIEGVNMGTLSIPSKVNEHTFFFGDLPMKWDSDYQSFVSTGSKIGLNSINGTPINKMLTCYVEFKMPSNDDDRVYIYIKSPSELFYYFGFKQGILSVVSNNTKFNEEVLGMKKKETVLKMDDGETYEIQPINPNTAQMFVRRVQSAGK